MDKAALKRFAGNGDDKPNHPPKRKLNAEERRALFKIKEGAKKAGSYLASGGEGGLPPSLVLGIFRRDKWRCKTCGQLGTEENGGLELDHKYQHITEPKARAKGVLALKQGRKNDPSQIASICHACHNKRHEEDRAEHGGEDAQQMLEGGA